MKKLSRVEMKYVLGGNGPGSGPDMDCACYPPNAPRPTSSCFGAALEEHACPAGHEYACICPN